MAWLVEAGLHRRAGETTLAVARDLAVRMDYRLGFVLYDLEGTAVRCGVSTATVKRHVRVLRELGALVWHRHGTRKNLHLPGRLYAGTATIYAATIPVVFDLAMGHRLKGAGYEARVCGVTDAARARAIEAAQETAHPVDNSVADKPGSAARAPHSPGFHHDVPEADPGERLNYTSRERATSSTASTPRVPRANSGSRRSTGGRGPAVRATRSTNNTGSARPSRGGSSSPSRSPWQVARDIVLTRQVRPLVGWTQREGLRRLAFALRPLIDRGLDAHDIAAELHGLALDWRPARPAAYITTALARDRQAVEAESGRQGHAGTRPSEAFSRAVEELRKPTDAEAAGVALAGTDGSAADVEGLSRAEVIDLRTTAAHQPELVLAALEHLGERDTRRLYTNRLVDAVLLREFSGTHMVAGG